MTDNLEKSMDEVIDELETRGYQILPTFGDTLGDKFVLKKWVNEYDMYAFINFQSYEDLRNLLIEEEKKERK